MIVRGAHHLPKAGRVRGFTLVELLITISIIGIMASMVVFAMFQAQEAAREQKTRTLITKLSNIIAQRYESYRTRRVPIDLPRSIIASSRRPGDQAYLAIYNKEMAKARLDCLHDLMRMEMPDRWSDVLDNPVTPLAHSLPAMPDGTPTPAYAVQLQRPSINQAYVRKYQAITGGLTNNPAYQDYQGAECLYMIVMEALAQEGDSRDVFKSTDVGDFDNDGFFEFLDAWGRPIRFLRWAPGYDSPTQVIGKISPSSNSSSGQSVRVRFPGKYFSPNGNYIGNVLAVIEPGTEQINSSRMGKVTGFEHTGAQAILTCETPSGQPQPFIGGVPTTSSTVAMMGPDPFDPRGIFPDYTYAETKTPNFNLVPLIYSGGSDKAYGIVADYPVFLQYSTVRLYPCNVPVGSPFGKLIGTKDKASSEPDNAWLDNITSHDLSRR